MAQHIQVEVAEGAVEAQSETQSWLLRRVSAAAAAAERATQL